MSSIEIVNSAISKEFFVISLVALVFFLLYLWVIALGRRRKSLRKRRVYVTRSKDNPILSPIQENPWESRAVFNPTALLHNGRVHLLYRALGIDGISRIGYASSEDGVHFDERLPEPVFVSTQRTGQNKRYHGYHPIFNPSGGGWCGTEDPRMVRLNDRVYMTINMFDGWDFMRIALTSLSTENFEKKKWWWNPLKFLSPVGERHKNWTLFPEKIGGKFAMLHNLHCDDMNRVRVEYIDDIDTADSTVIRVESPDPNAMPSRKCSWHHRMRSAGPPPVKTDRGWLVLYHAHDKHEESRYKLGAILLNLEDPTEIIARSSAPILEPDLWYENNWKPGIIYASGAVIRDGTLFIYYGGGYQTVNVACVSLNRLLNSLHEVKTA